jgi:phosphoglycerate dehydrogenase-like enzyme
VDVLLVRSATKVRQDLIDACPGLKIIGRGGIGMDNIDVEYAKIKGLRSSTPLHLQNQLQNWFSDISFHWQDSFMNQTD